jgi:hypothetical protein
VQRLKFIAILGLAFTAACADTSQDPLSPPTQSTSASALLASPPPDQPPVLQDPSDPIGDHVHQLAISVTGGNAKNGTINRNSAQLTVTLAVYHDGVRVTDCSVGISVSLAPGVAGKQASCSSSGEYHVNLAKPAAGWPQPIVLYFTATGLTGPTTGPDPLSIRTF